MELFLRGALVMPWSKAANIKLDKAGNHRKFGAFPDFDSVPLQIYFSFSFFLNFGSPFPRTFA